MSQPAPSSRRPLSSALRLPIMFACALSVVALSAIHGGARAQQAAPQAQGTQLPPVPVEPPVQAQSKQAPVPQPKQAASAPQAKAAPKAQTKAVSKSAPAPQPAAQLQQVAPSTTANANASSIGPAAAAAKLEVKNSTGSALGLTPRETPATINIVTQKEMEEKGTRSLIEVYRSVPGVQVGNNPGEPGATVVRGFSKAVGYSIDGSRAADPHLVSRDYDAFNFERVEMLKGPASVVYGTNGLAGSINIVTKQATLDRNFVEGLVGYGSFNTARLGLGANIVLSPYAAMRSTVSLARSNGYIDDTDWEKISFTNNFLVKPSDRLKFTASVDYYKDDFNTGYWGTPLVPRSIAKNPTDIVSNTAGLVIDKSLRSTNYNYGDGTTGAETYWLRGAAEYKLSSEWTLKNELNYYNADRRWKDAEFFNYAGGFVQRSANLISHDHQFWSDRATLGYDGQIGGLRNRFVAGTEYMETSFDSTRHFGNPRNVDVFNPIRAAFPADTAANFDSGRTFHSTQYTTSALFAENAINLTPSWVIAAGIRHEKINLDRSITNDNTGLVTTAYQRDLDSTTWRVGSSYEIFKGTSVFAQYATSVIPITTLMTASLANGKFELSTGESVEAGIKSTWAGGRVTTTASLYQIDQDNILTRDPANSTLTIQGGSQRSRGVEVDTSVALTDRWNLSLAGTLIDAEYTKLTERAGGVAVDRSGNRPINASPYAWTASTSYRLPHAPVTIGLALHNVGPFFTDTANLTEARARTLLDAWVAYDIGGGTLRIRGRNLTNEFYAEWADYNPTSVYLGAPRSVDATYTFKW